MYEYLRTDALRTRQVVAAWIVRDCRHVLELGGGDTPITDFVVGAHESVTVVDPAIKDFAADIWRGRPCRVRHWALPVEQYAGCPADGLVMLGWEGFRHMDRNAIYQLVRSAEIVVMECSREHGHAAASVRELRRTRSHRPTMHLATRYTGDGVGDELHVRMRDLFVLRRNQGTD